MQLDGKFFFKWEQMVVKMIKKGADVNIQDNDGQTTLIFAASGGNTNIVTKLNESGTDKDMKENQGNTVLMWAVQKDHVPIAALG